VGGGAKSIVAPDLARAAFSDPSAASFVVAALDRRGTSPLIRGFHRASPGLATRKGLTIALAGMTMQAFPRLDGEPVGVALARGPLHAGAGR
jgi:hypothetical protein